MVDQSFLKQLAILFAHDAYILNDPVVLLNPVFSVKIATTFKTSHNTGFH